MLGKAIAGEEIVRIRIPGIEEPRAKSRGFFYSLCKYLNIKSPANPAPQDIIDGAQHHYQALGNASDSLAGLAAGFAIQVPLRGIQALH